MKKILALGISLFMALAPMTSAFACEGADCTNETSETSATLPLFVEDKNRFKTEAEKLSIDNNTRFNSSVFFAANEINDAATVDNGINFSAGNSLKMSGQYEYGAHAGNIIDITGSYARDLFVGGNKIDITKDAKIGRDIYAAGNVLKIETNIPGNIYFAGNEIALDNTTISGDLVVATQKIVFGDNVVIEGTFKYNDDIEIENSAKTIGAEEKYHLPRFKLNPVTTTIFSLLSGIFMTVLGLFLFKGFFKKIVEKTAEMTFVGSLTSFCVGFGAMIIVPLVAIFLCVTLIGIIPAIAALLVYIALLIFSSSVTAVVIGEKFIKTKNPILNACIAVAVLTALAALPAVGLTIGFIVSMFGFGLTLRVLFKK